MSARRRPLSTGFSSSLLHLASEVDVPSPLGQSSISVNEPIESSVSTPGGHFRSTMSNCSSSRVDNLSERLKQVDFDSPAKIFQNKHAVYQFQSVTPNIATPNSERDEYFQSEGNGGGLSESESGSKTPINDSNAPSFGSSSPEEEAPSKPASTTISRQNTPAQFVFKKPEYNSHYHSTHFHHLEKKDTIFHDLKRFFKKSKSKKKCLQDDASSVRSGASSVYSKASDLSFANEFNKNIEGRYGKWGEFVGKGSGGSVRIIRRNTDGKTFAVKEFRKRLATENEKEYVKKVTAEFCIGSTLHNHNVIEALDIIQEGQTFYEIMEYAPNDLFNIVMSGRMEHEEVACCWHQLLDGVKYLQSMGIAHRDLKLDNLVLDDRGIVKIIDFGCSTVIKYPFENHFHMSKGICGSDPYIAPEQYTQKEYDARKTDLWSCGIILICMVIRRFPWRLPRPDKDQSFKNFVQPGNEGAERLFKLLPRYMRPVISHILITDPEKRYTLEEVLANEWVKSISICTPDRPARGHPHHLLVEPSRQVQQGRNLIVLPPSKEEEEKKKKKPAK